MQSLNHCLLALVSQQECIIDCNIEDYLQMQHFDYNKLEVGLLNAFAFDYSKL